MKGESCAQKKKCKMNVSYIVKMCYKYLTLNDNIHVKDTLTLKLVFKTISNR